MILNYSHKTYKKLNLWLFCMKVEIDSMVVVVAVKDAQFHSLSPIPMAVKDAQFQSFWNKNIIKLDAQFDQRIGSKLHQIPNQPTHLNKK